MLNKLEFKSVLVSSPQKMSSALSCTEQQKWSPAKKKVWSFFIIVIIISSLPPEQWQQLERRVNEAMNWFHITEPQHR